MKTLIKALRAHWLITSFLAALALTIGYTLITRPTPFYDWDESIYVKIGTEMVQNMSLLPTWQGVRWLDKSFLIPLFYAGIARLFFFVPAEISMRLTTLVVAITALSFVYALYYKATKNKIVAALTVVLSTFSPIILQRLQVVNMDIFVLLGWTGYLLFFRRFWLSFIFLAFAVGAKSFVGFYPIPVIAGYYLYLLWRREIKKKEFIEIVQKMAKHIALLSVWYIVMLILYKSAFIKEHIIETHFKRVTASIEFHFGQRIYYFTLIQQELGRYGIFAVMGALLLLYQAWKKKLKPEAVFYSFYLLPWFAFLNLTKTKIFWYILPVIPQFAYFASYPLTLLNNKKLVTAIIAIMFIFPILHQNIVKDNYLAHKYSTKEDHYYLALYAKNHCDELGVLVNQETRDSFKTLSDMNLLITTSKWWGSHPSIMYYFGKQVYPFYEVKEYEDYINKKSGAKKCVMIEKTDEKIKPKNMENKKTFNSLFLFQ